MLRPLVLLAALAVGGIAAGAVSAALVPATVSSNWAGYALTAQGDPGATEFTNVTGSWIQPKATCAAGAQSSSAFWVGLGGSSEGSQALEQIGTEARCAGSSAAAVHTAWYELVPAPPVTIKLKVRPGDRLTGAVLVNGSHVTLQITNATRHWRFTKNVTLAEPDLTSAEWIAEAPSACNSFGRCRPVPLANFGTVSFTRAAATASGHAGVISDATWTTTPIQLDGSGQSGAFRPPFGPRSIVEPGAAVPSELSPDGRSFSVAWQSSQTG
ncbi:MAG TPA: G1 family glutamic endopeptidase [Gaiellaceae bacterium]|jgi:hypothetical protein